MKHTSIGIIAAVLVMLFVGQASAWYGDYGYRIPLNIDNTAGSALTNYQLNVSLSGIDADSIRVVNETAGTTIPHWCETVTGGDCYEVWFNVTNLPAGVWTNSTYYIYYQYSGAVCAADFNTTFTKTYDGTGLVLEMHLDEGTGVHAYDSSGVGNHGIVYNMLSPHGWQGVDGGQWGDRGDVVFVDGDHLRFDGVDDYIAAAASDSLSFGTNDFALSAWVYSDGFSHQGSSFNGVMARGTLSGTQSSYYGFHVTADNHVRFSVNVDSCRVISSSSIQNGWHHLVGCRNNNNLYLYVDGVYQGVDTVTGSTTSTSSFVVGRDTGANRYFNGSIDEVRIYNRSLSEEEIYRQYIRSKYTPDHPSTSLGATETNITVVEHLEGWQGLGQDAAESYSDLVMIIGVCVLILVVGGIIIGLRSFAGDVSPEVVIIVAIAIGFGLLVLITMVEVVPSVMAPMEEITMEGL